MEGLSLDFCKGRDVKVTRNINQVYHIWILSWFLLEIIGAALFMTVSPMIGLLLMVVGITDVLTPFVAYANDYSKKRIDAYFAKRKKSKGEA